MDEYPDENDQKEPADVLPFYLFNDDETLEYVAKLKALNLPMRAWSPEGMIDGDVWLHEGDVMALMRHYEATTYPQELVDELIEAVVNMDKLKPTEFGRRCLEAIAALKEHRASHSRVTQE